MGTKEDGGLNSVILPCTQGCIDNAALGCAKALGLNSFVSKLNATVFYALKSKLKLAAEFWSAKLLLNRQRASLQSQVNFSRQLITYLTGKGLASEFNPGDGLKSTVTGLDDGKVGLKGCVLSIEKM